MGSKGVDVEASEDVEDKESTAQSNDMDARLAECIAMLSPPDVKNLLECVDQSGNRPLVKAIQVKLPLTALQMVCLWVVLLEGDQLECILR